MRQVFHLLAHDARQHWPLLGAWVVIVVAHPLVAAAPWSEEALAFARVLGAGLVGARLVIAAAVIATLVQADSPIDDRSFWRTRPIAPVTMAAAKLTLACAVFVVIPLLVVLGVAVAVGVPAAHWPAIIVGVLIVEVPAVMLAVLVAARTRRSSTALVGLAGGMALLLLLVAVAGQVVIHSEPLVRRVEPLAAPVALAGWVAVCVTALACAVWWGVRARAVLSIGTAVGVLGAFAIWLVPTVRSVSSARMSALEAPRLTRLDVRRAAGGSVTLAAVVAHPAGTTTNVLMENVTVVIGARTTRLAGTMPAPVSPTVPSERAFTVANLSEADAMALKGQPVHVAGHIIVVTAHRRTEARAALAAGARLDGLHLRAVVERVGRPTEDVPVIADLSVLRLAERAGVSLSSDRLAASLRNSRTQTRHDLQLSPREGSALASLVQLPVIARPFTVQRLSVRAKREDLAVIDPATSELALDLVDLDVSFADVAGTLPMPAVPTETRP